MENKETIGPLDTGQRNRRKRSILLNRRTLMAAFWVINIIVKLARVIEDLFDGS